MIAVGVSLEPAARRVFLLPFHHWENRGSMNFYSILFETFEDLTEDDSIDPPAFFADLNCDQIVTAITAGRDEYNLKPFFHACLHRVGAIRYRHEVMQDLEITPIRDRVGAFARSMGVIREHLSHAQKLHYKEQRQAWFLDAAENYCRTIRSFANDLAELELKSRGFLGFRDFLMRYVDSAYFNALVSESRNLKADLADVGYCIHIKGDGFTVQKFQGEADYGAEVEATFAKFKQGAVTDYRINFNEPLEMNHIEAKILEFVGKLHPDVFVDLDNFCSNHNSFMDQTVSAFDREVQFYFAYLEYIAALKVAALQFCYPIVNDKFDEVYDDDGFDIALAHKLVGEGSSVVSNDFFLRGKERILVISGPNQGGKTTFARTFGQLHYLGSLGCPVPGRTARLMLFDHLFTHFEREERVENLRGKLEDDLTRVHDLLSRATPRSVIILNEIFTSATIHDEIFLSTKLMERILEIGALCVWVTFADELASFGPQTVSMVSTIVPENPTLRTFRIVRRPADGLAYAMAIAQNYGLSYGAIKERIRS
jgi:DNA mismatch repair protein MutS